MEKFKIGYLPPSLSNGCYKKSIIPLTKNPIITGNIGEYKWKNSLSHDYWYEDDLIMIKDLKCKILTKHYFKKTKYCFKKTKYCFEKTKHCFRKTNSQSRHYNVH